MTRDELKAKYCMDVTLGELPIYEYEVTFTLKGGPKQKAYALARGDHFLGAINAVKEYQIPKQYQKYFAATARPVKKVYEKAIDAPKNWHYTLNKDRKVKNLIPPKLD